MSAAAAAVVSVSAAPMRAGLVRRRGSLLPIEERGNGEAAMLTPRRGAQEGGRRRRVTVGCGWRRLESVVLV